MRLRGSTGTREVDSDEALIYSSVAGLCESASAGGFRPNVGDDFTVQPRYSSGAQSPGGMPMERRRHRRVPLQIQGFLLGNSHEIEGHTLDLSLGGARFESDLTVFPGKTIMVRLVVPGSESPVSIAAAEARAGAEGTFGGRVDSVRPD